MANENATKIQLRHDSSANWFANNPILGEGEVGIEIDKNRMKVGNGISHYNDLEYFSDTVDYNELINKPQINSIGLMGNLSLHELGIQAEGDYATVLTLTEGLSEKADKADTYTKTEIDSKYATKTELSSKADSNDLPASTSLMNGTAPFVADFAGTDIDNLKIELNEFLAQLKTRGIIA